MFGKLTLSAIPFDQPIIMGAGALMVVLVLAALGALTWFGKWKWLWSEWLTSVDHKKIGVMYIVVAVLMLLRGFADAVMMRLQLALAYDSPGYLPPHHYDQIFTAHGVIMIFFMAMALMVGLFNLIVPLQIGARDVAFPFLNSLSFWMTAISAILINLSLVIGEFAQVGWLAYPPLSELQFSPGVGVDYYIWSLQLSGVGTLITAINFFVTIIRMRAPGMSLMKMPVFTWTALCSNVLIMATFPILTVTLALLGLDRYLGMHFFTNDGGGNAMMYLNLIWAWGHPEVYILVLPAFGIYSEVIATFAKKPLVRLPHDGVCNLCDHGAGVPRLAASLLHDGFRRGRQCVLRHYDHGHRHSDRRKDIQLAVHDLSRTPRIHRAGALDDRLHDHVHDRRHDRRDDGDSRRGLRAA